MKSCMYASLYYNYLLVLSSTLPFIINLYYKMLEYTGSDMTNRSDAESNLITSPKLH